MKIALILIILLFNSALADSSYIRSSKKSYNISLLKEEMKKLNVNNFNDSDARVILRASDNNIINIGQLNSILSYNDQNKDVVKLFLSEYLPLASNAESNNLEVRHLLTQDRKDDCIYCKRISEAQKVASLIIYSNDAPIDIRKLSEIITILIDLNNKKITENEANKTLEKKKLIKILNGKNALDSFVTLDLNYFLTPNL